MSESRKTRLSSIPGKVLRIVSTSSQKNWIAVDLKPVLSSAGKEDVAVLIDPGKIAGCDTHIASEAGPIGRQGSR